MPSNPERKRAGLAGYRLGSSLGNLSFFQLHSDQGVRHNTKLTPLSRWLFSISPLFCLEHTSPSHGQHAPHPTCFSWLSFIFVGLTCSFQLPRRQRTSEEVHCLLLSCTCSSLRPATTSQRWQNLTGLLREQLHRLKITRLMSNAQIFLLPVEHRVITQYVELFAHLIPQSEDLI
jgi:hypothetical protein